jgi:hypothetical protein
MPVLNYLHFAGILKHFVSISIQVNAMAVQSIDSVVNILDYICFVVYHIGLFRGEKSIGMCKIYKFVSIISLLVLTY